MAQRWHSQTDAHQTTPKTSEAFQLPAAHRSIRWTTITKISQRITPVTNKRHQSILKDQNLPQISVRATGSTSDADSEYEDDDDDDDPLLNGIGILRETTKDAENDEPANRKFFKSKASTTTKKYQIMNGLSATLKRGNDFKLELPAKRVRRAKGMCRLFPH